jgi:hypothetical protein
MGLEAMVAERLRMVKRDRLEAGVGTPALRR